MFVVLSKSRNKQGGFWIKTSRQKTQYTMAEDDKGEPEIAKLETVQDTKKRFSIIMILLLTTLIIGVPLWYFTTSVERATLPIDAITALNEQYLNNIKYEIPVRLVEIPDPLSGFIDETQDLLNEKLTNSNVRVKLFKNDYLGPDVDEKQVYDLKMIMSENEDKLLVSPYSDRLIKLFVSPDVIKHGLVSDLLSRILIENVFKSEINENNSSGTGSKTKNLIKFPFSTSYKVSINFLHSDNKMLSLPDGVLEKAVSNFKSFMNSLDSLTKFTVEFQELWYENRLITKDEYEKDGFTYIKDPSMFIDYSDWGLDQDVELDPVINLNLYLPDSEKLLIENTQRNSFIIPQWGGVVIVNDDETVDYNRLNEVFDIFAFQILKLIGVDTDPDRSIYYRIDELIRIQTVENLNNSLNNFKSLIKLINQLETIPIPLQSVDEINESIRYIQTSAAELAHLNWLAAYKHSTLALKLSNNAFFHEDMVQQAYFPEEHKMAVYSPLLGPFVTIVVMALVRGLKEVKSVCK